MATMQITTPPLELTAEELLMIERERTAKLRLALEGAKNMLDKINNTIFRSAELAESLEVFDDLLKDTK
jgi:hypothetical protein